MVTLTDVEFYKKNGYLLVKNVFSLDEVDEMRAAVDTIIERAAQTKYDRNTQWQGDFLSQDELKQLVLKGFHDIHYHDAVFTKATIHPHMRMILSALIGPNVQLHHSKMLVKPPEKGAAFPMHQDYPYFPHANHSMMAASVHLDDADEENGCIHVIPGSHLQGPLEHERKGSNYLDPRDYEVSAGTPCPASAGDVLFFNYLTIHGSNPNRSQRTRRNVLYQYRDPLDQPTQNVHVNWGQGLMICGHNPVFKEYR